MSRGVAVGDARLEGCGAGGAMRHADKHSSAARNPRPVQHFITVSSSPLSRDAVDSDAARPVMMPCTHVAAAAGDTRGLHGSLGKRHAAATWKTPQLDASVLPCFSFLRILNSQIEAPLQRAFAPGSTRSDTSSTLRDMLPIPKGKGLLGSAPPPSPGLPEGAVRAIK
jgi:hypothetical protein